MVGAVARPWACYWAVFIHGLGRSRTRSDCVGRCRLLFLRTGRSSSRRTCLDMGPSRPVMPYHLGMYSSILASSHSSYYFDKSYRVLVSKKISPIVFGILLKLGRLDRN